MSIDCLLTPRRGIMQRMIENVLKKFTLNSYIYIYMYQQLLPFSVALRKKTTKTFSNKSRETLPTGPPPHTGNPPTGPPPVAVAYHASLKDQKVT